MNALENRKLLLSVLAILLGVKFILMPWFSWQNELFSQNSRLNSQLTKGQLLTEKEAEIREYITQLDSYNQQYKKRFINEEPSEIKYRLTLQKAIEDKLEEKGLSQSSVSWLPSVKRGPFEEQMIQLTIKGRFKSFAEFLVEIEQVEPRLSVRQIQLNVSKVFPQEKLLGNARGTVVLSGLKVEEKVAEDG